MLELITSRALPQAEFVVSLPLCQLSTMSLTHALPQFEGLSPRLWPLRHRLEGAFLDEMGLVLGFAGHFHQFMEQLYLSLLALHPALDHAGLVDLLHNTPVEAYVDMAQRALARSTWPALSPEQTADLLHDREALVAHLSKVHLPVDLEAAVEFLQDLTQLKFRLIAVVEHFWQRVYRDEWASTQAALARSVAFHARQQYHLSFPDLFMAVTGRLLPDFFQDQSPERVCFVPSCYLGPYFNLIEHPGGFLIFYNCRTPTINQPRQQGPDLFPILKALADETRLQILEMVRGDELYAQQIVDQLDISQAAVSRHLRLMVSAGVLQVRKEGGAKFYTVNGSTLGYLAQALQKLSTVP